ncbi:MAG: sugar phosphate isomerase/epimerase family protein [Anaerolineae bacterium]
MIDRPEVGISTAAFYPGYLTEEALTAIAELGFRTVEIFLQADGEYTMGFGAVLDRRRRELGLQVHSLHLYATLFDLWAPYPRMAEEVRDRFRRLLEVAAMLNATALTWHGLRYGLDNPRLVDAFLESAVWAGNEARAAGLTLCIENVSWCYLRTPEQVWAIREADLPVAFTFDSFQAGESGVEPAALVRAMGDRLTTVHLSDYRDDGPRHLPPGQGDLDWPRLLRALQAAGYSGPLILEPAHVEALEVLLEARRFLHRVWDDVEQGSGRPSH